MKRILSLFLLVCGLNASAQPTTANVWFNEFHYDGVTTSGQSDQNEFIELVIQNSLLSNASELAKLKVVLYTSGALDAAALSSGRGLPYNETGLLYTLAQTEHPLGGFQACPIAGTNYTALYKPMSILQDVPAGFALVYNNTAVVQLLSYEKAFAIRSAAAGGGAAGGMATTLIAKLNGQPAQENALTLTNHAVALIGTGVSYNQFRWTDTVTQLATPCAANTGQVLSAGGALPVRWLSFQATGRGSSIYAQWKAADDAATLQYELEVKGGRYDVFTKLVTKQRQISGEAYDAELKNLAQETYILRVKAAEAGGKVSYSSERMVRLGKAATELTLYPNPVKSGAALMQFAAGGEGVYTVQIIDAAGSMVKQQPLGRLKALQLATLNLDVSDLLPGVYLVKVKGAGEELNAKLIVVH